MCCFKCGVVTFSAAVLTAVLTKVYDDALFLELFVAFEHFKKF